MLQRALSAIPLNARRKAKGVLPASLWRWMRDWSRGQAPLQRAHRRWRLSRVARRHTDRWQQQTTAVELADQVYVALVTRAFRASEVLAHHLNLVADVLEAHGIPYFVLDAEPQCRRVVALPQEHRQRAWEALTHDLAHLPVYVAPVRDQRPGRSRLIRSARMPRAAVWRLFCVQATEDHGYLGGSTLGCDIEFWRRVEHAKPAYINGEPLAAGALVPPRRNSWADAVGPDEQATRQELVDNTPRPMLAAIHRPHLFTVTEPVDVVYTWVDGSDPEWRRRKAEADTTYLERGASVHRLAANDSRFLSRDELKYSMRSLDMYADWVRHVYVVTDGQVPSWLDLDNPRLTWVTHQQLFGHRGLLPTFNSHAIESQLHHIHGLSEHYLYLNDDVFFGRPVSPSLFFHSNGLTKFNLSNGKIGLGPAAADDTPVMSAAKNNRDLVLERFGRTVSNKFQHVPHALRRSVMFDMEREFEPDFKRTAASQFRDPGDISISASLAHYYGYATGRAVPGALQYFYADIAREDTPSRLTRLLLERNCDVFCLNDHDSGVGSAAHQMQQLVQFLQAYFPQPSSFERLP